jgi:hypothetical protein
MIGFYKILLALIKMKEILILTILKNSTSWGCGRSFYDYLSLINGLDYPQKNITIGLLISDIAEFHRIKNIVARLQNSEIKWQLFHYKDPDEIPIQEKRMLHMQNRRRSMLAKLRNMLIKKTINIDPNISGVIWIDSDLIKIPSGLLKIVVNSGKDIIMPFCDRENPNNYRLDFDLNGYKIEDGERRQLGYYFKEGNTEYAEYIEIDSVGGTFLYVDAKVFRDNVLFSEEAVKNKIDVPVFETEGLCVEAQKKGYKCWFLNGEENKVMHHDIYSCNKIDTETETEGLYVEVQNLNGEQSVCSDGRPSYSMWLYFFVALLILFKLVFILIYFTM